MFTVTVSIGRNLRESGELRDELWVDFQAQTLDCVALWTDSVLFQGTGVGVWTDEDGQKVTEDAFTVVAQVAQVKYVSTFSWALSKLAAAYGQESIALTY